ncbi:MAG TPA: hypothetical protein VLD35_07410 [Caldimonas sp.]|nr:hypothetical protein [Caldimonas sp.]
MRSVSTLALIALLYAAPAGAARGVASATIVVPVAVASAPADGSPSLTVTVSVTMVRDGANEHVTVAFN